MEDDLLLPGASLDVDDERPSRRSSGRAGRRRCPAGASALESSTSAASDSPPSDLLSAASDEVLGILVVAGDVEALSILMDRHLHALQVCAQEIVHDPLLAEGVALEVFEWLWEHRRDWHPRKVEAFLLSKARSLALSLRRSRRSRRQRETAFATVALPSPETPDAILEREQLGAHMRQAIGCLPPRQQMAVVLRVLEGLSYAAIGERMGISARTAEHHVEAGLAKLRALLATDAEDWLVSSGPPGPREGIGDLGERLRL